MSTTLNGKVAPTADARRVVAYARHKSHAVLIHGRADPQKSISDQESGYRSEADMFNHALELARMAHF